MKKIVILFSLILIFGCSSDDSKSEEVQEQDPNAIIADNVVVILEENSELMSTESEILNGTYVIQFSESIPEIEINDVIVGDEGLGFLRKVTSISVVNNVVEMQTVQANMEDVFGNTNINFSTSLSSFNRSSSGESLQRNNYERFAQGVSRNQNSFIFDFTNVVINSDPSANLTITDGALNFNPTYFFDLDYSFFSLDRFQFGTENTEFTAEATLNLNATGSATIPVTEYTLYENSNTFVRFVGSVPVVVTVFLKLKAKSEFEVGGTLSLSKKLEHNTTFSLGATYENSNWSPIAELNAGFIDHPIDLGGSYFNLTDKISIVPEVIIAFYGINGPLIEPALSGNLGINVGVNQDWDASLNASIDLNLGASIGILGENLLALPYDSYNIYTQPIWNAPDTIEVISGNNQTGNQDEQLNQPLKVRVWDNSGLFYLKDVPVYFEVTSGNGTTSNQTVPTDPNGFAEVFWTLGDNTQPQIVQATVKKADGSNIESIATFNANLEGNQVDLSGNWTLNIFGTSGSCTNNVTPISANIQFEYDMTTNTITYINDPNNLWQQTSGTISYNENTQEINFDVVLTYSVSSTIGCSDGTTYDPQGDTDTHSFSGILTAENYFTGTFTDALYLNGCTIDNYECTYNASFVKN
ncbi:hypothetical protein DFQ10_10825 [Winogradskyella eximia]|uniref:Big-1 domain-containing protein n=1 Tax=Winogradskyella eximia TaxID=262006 RepID=A0A3D9GZD2_9FLAO|nr:hypothetical protein [Winogradskyella eximia]RED42618.1 hypothetical protein DFQ10_10825 [Winogradskyella eximia]